MYEAVWAYGGTNLFCRGLGFTKQILKGAFGVFCFMLLHDLHVLRIVKIATLENMRLMRKHEDGVIKGFHLPCIEMGVLPGPKYEAVMRMYEDDPHVFARGGAV